VFAFSMSNFARSFHIAKVSFPFAYSVYCSLQEAPLLLREVRLLGIERRKKGSRTFEASQASSSDP